MGKVKNYVPRSRTGCVTCKKRRVKCDETRPICSKCSRLGLACAFQKSFLWEDDAKKRGITFGRSAQARRQRRFSDNGGSNDKHNLTLSSEDIKNIERISIKREHYFFLNTSTKDCSELLFGEIASTVVKRRKSTLVTDSTKASKKPVVPLALLSNLDLFSPGLEYGSAPSVTKITPHLSNSREDHNIVDLNSLVLLENGLKHEHLNINSNKPRNLNELLVPFFSNSIPKMFSSSIDFAHSDISQDRVAGQNEDASFSGLTDIDLQIDDIFLQSFASPHLTSLPLSSHLSLPLLALTESSTENLENALPAASFSPLEQQLLKYFTDFICPSCVCYPDVKNYKAATPDSNPYLYLIVPLAYKSRLVKKVIVAASAKQLVLLGKTDYEETAKQYSYEVLKELPRLIGEKQAKQEKNWDDVLTTVLMLCFTEISVNCNSSWLVHLNGAKLFLKEACVRNNLSPIGKFFVRYFISHEIMGETAWVYDPGLQSMQPISDDPYIEALKQDPDTKIDLVLGCSPFLITMVHRISVLGKCFEDLEHESQENRAQLEQEIISQANILETSLDNLQQKMALSTAVENNIENASPAEKCINVIAEIKRLAALIYLFARIYLEYQFYHGSSALFDSKMETAKTNAKRIIELHNELPDCYVSLLWPIFIVGMVTAGDDEEERWFVLNSLTQMERLRELRSVKTAKDVVLSVWKERDLGKQSTRWRDMIRGRANTISLA